MMLNLIYALLGLAVFIALLGIANTLALSIFERTRELGLLRAVGMTRRQLRATVRYESVIIALLGTTLGLAIGIGFGWSIVKALYGRGARHLRVPGQPARVVTVIAAIAGVAAAYCRPAGPPASTSWGPSPPTSRHRIPHTFATPGPRRASLASGLSLPGEQRR